jgi:uncharacterized MAPEG superfamily protein
MIELIIYTSILYFAQIIMPNMVKSKLGEVGVDRARKAAHNLRESLLVFYTFAVLSIVMEIQANVAIASIWLSLRLVFVALYISGFNTKPVNESGYVAQPLRSWVWFGSIVCLCIMGTNLLNK